MEEARNMVKRPDNHVRYILLSVQDDDRVFPRGRGFRVGEYSAGTFLDWVSIVAK